MPLLLPGAGTCTDDIVWQGTSSPMLASVWEPACYPPVPPGAPPNGGGQTPIAGARRPVRKAPQRPRAVRLTAVRLSSHRFAAGRQATLRFRVTASATVRVSLQRLVGRHHAWRPLPARRALVWKKALRKPAAVTVKIGRDGKRHTLPVGRYRVVVQARAGRASAVARVPFTLLRSAPVRHARRPHRS